MKFKQRKQVTEPEVVHEKVLTREEIDAKHEAAFDSKTIISWKSPVRVFKARSKKYFTKVALYGIVFSLAAFAWGEYVLVGVILAVIFVVYVLSTAAPDIIEHRITNMGIVSGGRAFLWEELLAFWFDRNGDERLLVIETDLRFPSRLIILLAPTVNERTLLDLLEKHLHYHPGPVHSVFDKWAAYLQRRINFE